MAPWLENTGSIVVVYGLSCSVAWGDLSRTGIKPVVFYTGRQIFYHGATREAILYIFIFTDFQANIYVENITNL